VKLNSFIFYFRIFKSSVTCPLLLNSDCYILLCCFGKRGVTESTREYPARWVTVDLIPASLVAPGISSHILSIIPMHGEGDPTPILVQVGTTHGTCHTTQLVGMSSSLASHLVVPEVGHSRSPVGPSDNYIIKHVLSAGKVFGVCFKVEDMVEESRLVALEARDGAAKATMGDISGVP